MSASGLEVKVGEYTLWTACKKVHDPAFTSSSCSGFDFSVTRLSQLPYKIPSPCRWPWQIRL